MLAAVRGLRCRSLFRISTDLGRAGPWHHPSLVPVSLDPLSLTRWPHAAIVNARAITKRAVNAVTGRPARAARDAASRRTVETIPSKQSQQTEGRAAKRLRALKVRSREHALLHAHRRDLNNLFCPTDARCCIRRDIRARVAHRDCWQVRLDSVCIITRHPFDAFLF